MADNRRPTERGFDVLADERTKEVLDNISRSITDPSLNLLVVGKTNVGKTSLIHSLFENDEAGIDTDVKPKSTQALVLQTLNIPSPRGSPVSLTLIDTPGTEALLGVGSRAERKEYIKTVSNACKASDIVLYCVRMDDAVRESDVEMIRFFLKNFGPRIWTKVVIVLTFANRVTADHTLPEKKQRAFEVQFHRMNEALVRAMRQAGLAEEVAKATSFCIAGHPKHRSLPDCDDWAFPFLVNCVKSGIADNAKAVLLQATWKRWTLARMLSVSTVAGATGVATGIGFIVVGGIMASTPVTAAIGAPLAVIGSGITIYSVSASVSKAVIDGQRHRDDMDTVKQIQDLQPETRSS